MVGTSEDNNIWIASSDGDIELVKSFLETQSANAKDDNGYTPIHAAASYNHTELLRMLVDQYKGNINIQDEDGDTPLHVCQDLETVKVLIELHADPTIRNKEGKLPIECAFIESAMDVVEFLKEFTPDFCEYEQEDSQAQLEHLLQELQSQGIQVSEVVQEQDEVER